METNRSNQEQVVARLVLVHGEAYGLPKDASGVRVRAGRAWLSIGGEDVILGRRDEVRFASSEAKGGLGAISPVGRVPLMIEVLGGARLARHVARLTLGQRT